MEKAKTNNSLSKDEREKKEFNLKLTNSIRAMPKEV
jgi:hypothetical protein